MKITKNLTHVVSSVDFQAALNEKELANVLGEKGMQGFPAELDIAERTEEHVQIVALEDLLGFAKASGVNAVTVRRHVFPSCGRCRGRLPGFAACTRLGIDSEVIRSLCAEEIDEYLALDKERDAELPVHSIVEAYIGGTAFAWYGINELSAP